MNHTSRLRRSRVINRTFPLVGAIIASHAPALAQDSQTAASQPAAQSVTALKKITQELVSGRGGGGVDFDGSVMTGMTWLPDGRHFLHRRDGKLLRVDALTDQGEPAYDLAAFAGALQASGDFDERAARDAADHPAQWSNDRTIALVTHNDQLFLMHLGDSAARRLTPASKKPTTQPTAESSPTGGRGGRGGARGAAGADSRRELTLGPRGSHVAFVRDNDIYAIDADSAREVRLTQDGSKTILNGVLDWVYQEEVFGRGRFRSFWWSDDEKYVAYLQLDESPVPVFTVSDASPFGRPKLEETNYPKAGDPNPKVRVGIVPAGGGRTVWADLSPYKGTDILVIRASWGPDGRLYFQVQNREQTWLDLVATNAATGATQCILHDTSAAWIDGEHAIEPKWLADGSFLWLSTRDGYKHLYHYSGGGKLLRRVTSGDWEVHEIIGCDEAAGLVYFNGSRDTVLENHAYRVHLDNGRIDRLTEPGSNHAVNFDPTLHYFFDTWNNVVTPSKLALRSSDGALVRMISENEVKALHEYAWSRPEIVQVPTRNGKTVNALLIKPLDWNPTKKYPVWSSVYGGPAAPQVKNTWGGRRTMSNQPLVQDGYIYWVCDTQLAGQDGAVSAWQSYGRLGEIETEDLEDGVKWLIEHAAADPNRIGITGFSYGGYMTGYVMTHSKAFSVGICGAPVTDWHNYDSVYTERYMKLPEHNKAGYDSASVIKAAGNLYGDMLLVHGLIDDNVHFQNSVQFILELERARKMFDLMVYPLDRHGIGNGAAHFRELQLDYIKHRL